MKRILFAIVVAVAATLWLTSGGLGALGASSAHSSGPCRTVAVAPATGPMPVGAWGGYSNGSIPDAALVNVSGFCVAPGVAPNLTALLNAAKAAGAWDGSTAYATGTYRSIDVQQSLKAEKPGLAAAPGTSMHGWGEAVDFNNDLPKLISWLKANAGRFGFKNYPPEPWHYSTNGA